jgi:hypothetical protein
MSSATFGSLAGAACFLLTCALVCGGAVMIQKKIEPLADSADSYLESALIATAWIVLSSTVFGIIGLISRLNIFLADAAFFSFAFLLYKRCNSIIKTYSTPVSARASNFGISHFAVAIALLLAIAAWVWAWVSPPPPWDAFVYHLCFPAAWIKNGNIFLVTVPFGDQAGTYFPSNAELIYMRILLSLGQDFATNVLQLIYLSVACIAVYKLSLTCDSPKAESAVAAAAALFMPILFHQAVTSEVDLIFSSLFILSLYFIFRWTSNPKSRRDIVFAFISLGLFAGTKSIALVFILLIAAPAFIYVLISKRNWGAFLWGPALAAVFGGFWYVRNIVVTGNPVFPLSINAFGKEILHGAYTRHTMLQSLFHTDNLNEWLHALASGWGLPLLTLCCLATLLTFLWPGRDVRAKYLAAAPWLIAVLCFFVIPYNREVRFAFSAFLIACVSVAWIGSRIPRKISYIFLTLLVFVFIFNVIYSARSSDGAFYLQLGKHIAGLIAMSNPIYKAMASGALLLGIAALIGAFVFFTSFLKSKPIAHGRPLLILCGVFAAAGVLALSLKYPQYQYAYYSSFPMGQSWRAMHEQYPKPTHVAYTGTDISFGLTGPRLKNSVYYIPITRWEVGAFHECTVLLKRRNEYNVPNTDRIDFCRREPDYSTWVDRLADAQTELLYVTVLHQNDLPHLEHDADGFPVERQWADAHKDRFRLIYSNPQVRIYDVAR